jgi:hypothetical protein
MRKRSTKICSICEQKYEGRGNNAKPVSDGWCCLYCYWEVVIPAREHESSKVANNGER